MSLLKVTSPAAAACCASRRGGATTPTIAGSSTAAPIVSFQPILLATCIAHPPSGLRVVRSYYRRHRSGLTIGASAGTDCTDGGTMHIRTVLAGAVAGLVVAAALATAQTPTAADHKQWMDDAADIQDDL